MALKRRGPAPEEPAAGTVIGPGSELDGQLDIQHAVRVDGVLKGRLSTVDTLVVGEQGVVEADSLEVGAAVIRGRVKGHLKASRHVYLGAQSYFCGRVETPHLVIEEGAELLPPEARPSRAGSPGAPAPNGQ